MIVLLSIHGDTTTDEVCRILRKDDKNFLRINDDLVTNKPDIRINIDLQRNTFVRSSLSTSHDIQISSVWFRKFGFTKNTELFEKLNTADQDVKAYILSEYQTLLDFITFGAFEEAEIKIGSLHSPNKLEQLKIAKACSLDIPKTIITNNKLDLLKFMSQVQSVIIKPLRAGISFRRGNLSLAIMTSLIERRDIEKMPNSFLPSIFQEKIEKLYEVRVFVLAEKIYSMAIFSQLDQQTSLDFRNYNLSKPNRMVPYKLPAELEHKIHKFMVSCKLNTGSVDLIKTLAGGYCFLEVNSSGQFGMISQNCNYPLEELIAESLR